MDTNLASTDVAFVYVISDAAGHQKVGRAANPESRLRELSADRGEVLTLAGCVQVSAAEAPAVERAAHDLLAVCRLGRAEWFKVPPAEALAAIQQASGRPLAVATPAALKALTVKLDYQTYRQLRDYCWKVESAGSRRPGHQEVMVEALRKYLNANRSSRK